MTYRRVVTNQWLMAGLILLLSGCRSQVTPVTSLPAEPTASLAPTSISSTKGSAPANRLGIELLYPKPDTKVEMGQTVKFIARVKDSRGNPVSTGQLNITIQNPDGEPVATISSTPDDAGVIRTDAWTVPHHAMEGRWDLELEAGSESAQGDAVGSFQVLKSTSETLQEKYGFWLDAPSLRGIVPQIVTERGDAQNGLIRWGGIIPAQHVFPENWVEIQWRKGSYNLDSPEAVRRFLLDELGDLGITPIRDLGPYQPVQFEDWKAWKVGAKGQFQQIKLEWMVFYSPEVDKTYALGTTVVQSPGGLDAHALLRQSFTVDPNHPGAGVAPEALLRLLPGPELLAPALGSQFQGPDQTIVLQWEPVKELAGDEYYEVDVDYNYKETNTKVTLTTRETQIVLPGSLYQEPNCQVFNWQVTLMRKTGVDKSGRTTGEQISYHSLYWYLKWIYPPDQKAPFPLLCPNAQV